MKILHYGIVLLFMVTLWGCSQGNSSAPVTIDPATNKHPAGWALNGTGGAHPYAYFTAPTSCESCHGLPSDPKGGISGVSCSNPGRSGVACHPAFPHAPGFAQFSRHGSVAKDTASGVTGMAHCKQCHGSNYTGAGLAPSCIKCHNAYNASNVAPHAANWVAGNVNGLKHSTTVANNAPACYQCHAGGTYSHPAPIPAPPGTEPGCFNGTMCHNAAGHTFTVDGHQIPARSNLASCQPCHATPASGYPTRYTVPKNALLTPNGCENCHNRPGIAHPYMWVPGRGGSSTTSHANAGTVNASCGLCHGGVALTGGSFAYPGGIAPPSCFPASPINGTGCHFIKPVDASGTTIGCVSCHATPPNSVSPPTAGSPNQAFGHTKHWGFPGSTCSTCHNGSGYGTVTHANGTVQTSPFPAKFRNVSTSASSYSSATGTCSNISCHGQFQFSFQPWTDTTSVIDPLDFASCYNCHEVSTLVQPSPAGVPMPVPYIGPFSGKVPAPNIPTRGNNLHQAHTVSFGTECTQCHNLSVHFNNLMQGRRFLTRGAPNTVSSLGGPGTLISAYSYNAATGTSSCTSSCHGTDIRSWY